ncbi:unnamed protein product [Schistosoma mattheei]|uniref:Uncharacterized protein n=1 Tax=Schistosoma mattheei TaxID=31246 RepID=A0A183NRK9_9TREM|nr:unnamed protein product [Schistosoma mattheei]
MGIRQIKSGKAAGLDNIPAEALKSDVEVTASMFHTVSRMIWEEEQLQTDRKERCLIKILKKGDLRKCENYRDITLLLVLEKVFNSVVERDERFSRRPTSTSTGRIP